MDKVSVKGNDNFSVGRDLIISVDDIKSSDYKLYKIIDSKLRAIDEFVSRHVSGVKSHAKHEAEPFKSSIIIESMGKLGIPIVASIQAVGDASNKVVSKKPEGDSVVKSSFVRKCITEALYSLDGEQWSEYDIETWADSYIRRYGTETIIKIVGDSDGNDLSEEDLAISYFLKVVIPDVYRLITKEAGMSAPLEKIASKRMQRRMAEKIIDAVHALDLYRIHYSVLIALTKEIALQPPHPWFSPSVRSYEIVNYHYERYKLNNRKAIKASQESDCGSLQYATKEIIEHCCASILSYYSIYMGCGPMASFYVLQSIMHDICKEKSDDAKMMFRLDEIKIDLKNILVEEEQFAALLNRISKKLDETKKKDVLAAESLHIDSEDLAKITIRLIASFIRINRQKSLIKERKDISLSDIFLGFPHLEWDLHESQKAFWVTHYYKTPCFESIRSKILVVHIEENESLAECIEHWASEVCKHIFACNTVFLITKKEINIEEYIGNINFNRTVHIVPLIFKELLSASIEENPWNILERAIFKGCRTV